VAKYEGHSGPVTYLAFSSDGRFLMSASGDGTALNWVTADLQKSLPPSPPGPSHADVEALWADLIGDDAVKAYSAVCRFASTPGLAVPMLRERLPKGTQADTKPDVDRLLADLDHDDFDVREKATQELIRAGTAVLPAVREALAKTMSREVRRRAEEVVAKLQGAAVPPAVPPAVVRAARGVEVLEHIKTPEARELLESWASGPAGSPLTREAQASLKR
jgi:hypothetical protein